MNLSTLIKGLAISTMLFATSAFARDGSSGCGPGWYVFKESTFVSSAARLTIHGLSSPVVLLGMFLGTSNCKKHALVLNDKRGLHFVTHNAHNLVAEAAMGRGESLGALASAMGCGWQVQGQFNDVVKNNFAGIFGVGEAEPTELYGNMVGAVLADPMLAKSCSFSAI